MISLRTVAKSWCIKFCAIFLDDAVHNAHDVNLDYMPYVMAVFAARKTCQTFDDPVCLTCRNAVSESDCEKRGYNDTCSSSTVSNPTVISWIR